MATVPPSTGQKSTSASPGKPAGTSSVTNAPQPTKPAATSVVTAVKANAGKPAPAAPVVTAVRPPSFKIESAHNKARFIKMLVYGEYGSGKTWLLSTAVGVPDMQDVLMVDAEAGDMTISEGSGGFKFDKIDTVRVENYKQVAHVQSFLRTHCQLREEGDKNKMRELEAKLKRLEPDQIKEPRQYRTVIIDSLSEVESFCMYQLLGITDKTRLDEEVASAEWTEYKKQNSMIQRLVRGFRDLPMHVLVTCASSYTQDENKRMLYTPSLTGKLSRQVQGFMDVVGYLQTGQAESEEAPIPRRLYVQPTKGKRFAAKCRFSSFKGSYFDNATMGTILETVGLIEKLPTKKLDKQTKESTHASK